MTKFKHYQRNLNHFLSLFWVIGFLTCGVAAPSFAAEKITDINARVTGKVVASSDNLGMPGVNVLVKGTQKGTFTDGDGNYTIDNVDANSTLVFSFIGFESQEVTVGSQTVINVTLQDDERLLDEVIVVGYGTAKKETLTGSVEQVTSEAFEDLAVGSPALALQGRTPGLVVSRSSSRPGDEGVSFLIRGASSINGISPLIVIDGIPSINASSFNDMNPNDIESVSVLKGGSASVYGSRAAGGVILVTTKKGKGDVKVELSSVFRMGTIGIRPPSPTMAEYGQLYLAAVDEDLASNKPPRYFFWNDRPTLERIASGEEGYYDLPINGNVWLGNSAKFDEMFGNSASNQTNLSVSGGTAKSNYRISAGYDKNVGGLKVADDTADKYNFSANYGIDISDRLSLNTNITYFKNSFSGPAAGLAREAATWDAPLFPSYNPDGQYYANFGGVNITGDRNAIAQVKDAGRENLTREQFKVSAQATYKLTDHLNLTGSYALSKQNSVWQRYAVSVPLYSWQGGFSNNINNTTFIEEGTGPNTADGNITYNNYKAVLNYTNSFGDHNVSGIVGIEAEKNILDEYYLRRNGFVDYGVYDINIGATDQLVSTSGGGSTWGAFGYIGRLNYDYKGKYLLELQGRRDGSSRFAEGSKWSNYGSVSAGWVLSKEDFLVDNDMISFLKIRGGYGELGSTSGIGDFGYLSTVGFGTTVFGQTNASQQATSRASSLFSSTTTWERIATTEFGVDFGLFGDKMFGSFDLYKKNNIGMLVRGILPQTLGTAAPFTNIGTLETKGWEAMLGWRNKIGKDLDLAISANMSDSRNEITKYDGAQSIVENLNAASAGRNILGKPINSFYLWETDGYFGSQEEVNAYYSSLNAGGILPSQTSNDALRPGDMRVVDSNGDGTLDTDDLTYMGDNATHYVYGLNFDLKYKNFDLSGFFQGVLNQQIYRTGYFAQPFQAEWQNQSNTWLGRTWTEDNTDAEFPRLTTQRGLSAWNYRSKDHILQNNRYLRLKSLIVGYNIRGVKLGKTSVDNIRIYLSGNDLFEFTSVKDGYDPEFRASTNESVYPFMRTWAAGLKISL
ncbi:SusC/RagA family TonB-linked outer membrane protein [Arcticibacterium luteifluviistationis]|uniref:SusC/RagA family TonB-linked outer membrane protein n=1 Tax=Arcticibacterium luteifluviistationis TaxID=1784714 RepID=A0A2Z4G8X3_9BACT|nr:TonB-dependent receptor [Arcticibacterium luteifluviistationis]AWV97667.1 SusC/RagA family TonB-linked outer membrane protein [Arcticibacterium luteifluviistationis]